MIINRPVDMITTYIQEQPNPIRPHAFIITAACHSSRYKATKKKILNGYFQISLIFHVFSAFHYMIPDGKSFHQTY